jgi:hypothetical protein
MPTFPKLVASLCLGVLAWYVSTLIMAQMPEGTAFGMFLPLNVVIAFVTGWVYVGPQVMHHLAEGLSYGLTGAGVMTFVALFLQSGNEMMRLAMRHRYDGFLESIAAVFQIGVDFGSEIFTWPVIIALVVGGLITGLLTYAASLRWR